MAVAAKVMAGVYHDSVKLMRISAAASAAGGVRHAIAVLGTPMNLEQLKGAGLLTDEAAGAGPNDLVLAAGAADEDTARAALSAMEAALHAQAAPAGGAQGDLPAPTLDAALAGAALNLAVISIPGPYVRREAEGALSRGLHCLIFSDNVPLEDEIALKKMGRERGLLVMGPDCGTAHLGGMGLGFCNIVRPGAIGIAGAAGTGIQEAMAAIDAAGGGVRAAIGTGGRDVTDAVGALAMVDGIGRLARDEKTKILLVLGKPPQPGAMAAVLAAVGAAGKPAVLHFVGMDADLEGVPENAVCAASLAQAGWDAAALSAGEKTGRAVAAPEDLLERVAEWARAPKGGRRYLRGVYTGGTLCAEAQAMLGEAASPIRSNAPIEKKNMLADPRKSQGHTVLDMGEDFFTAGKPHPMMAPALRGERLAQEAADPEVAVVLFDVVLGLGAHPDPAGAAADAVRAADAKTPGVLCVASVTGTAGDPQGRGEQEEKLRAAGVLVAPNHAAACLLAVAALEACGR